MKMNRAFIFAFILIIIAVIGATQNVLQINPAGIRFSKVGESQKITCTSLLPDVNLSMLQVQMNTSNGWRNLQAEIVSNNTKMLTIPSLSLTDRGNYRCEYNGTTRRMRLFVNYPPRISGDVSCNVLDNTMMTCVWPLMDHENEIKSFWTITSTDGFRAWFNCPVLNYTAYVLTCTWPDITQFAEYNISIKGSNRAGTTERYFVVNTTQNVLLSKLAIGTEIGSTNVTLKWNRPENYLCVQCRVFYNITLRPTDETKSQLFVIDSANKTVRYVIKNLTPFTPYQIEVSGRPVDSIHWNKPSVVKITTDTSVPAAPPSTHLGLFSSVSSPKNHRKLSLYLQSISTSEINADNASYNIRLYQSPASGQGPIWNHNTSDLNGSIEIPSVLAENTLYTISVWSYNEKGFSHNATVIDIPTVNSGMSLLPKTVLVDGKCKLCSPGRYLVSWNMDTSTSRHISMFTTMWCKGSKSPYCEGGIRWLEYPSNETSAIIDVGDRGNSHWLFAVSAYNSTHFSGGLRFAVQVSREGEHQASDGGRVTAIVMGSVFGVLVLIILIAVSLCIRREFYKKEIEIQMPEGLQKKTYIIEEDYNQGSYTRLNLVSDIAKDVIEESSAQSSDSGVSSDLSIKGTCDTENNMLHKTSECKENGVEIESKKCLTAEKTPRGISIDNFVHQAERKIHPGEGIEISHISGHSVTDYVQAHNGSSGGSKGSLDDRGNSSMTAESSCTSSSYISSSSTGESIGYSNICFKEDKSLSSIYVKQLSMANHDETFDIPLSIRA